ncbi:MAG: TIGR02757 family protein [Bacteroidota bacterium]
MDSLKAYLDELVDKYNQPGFIPNDPISIPRGYTKKQDIEITGFVAAMLAWGQRKTIINKCLEFFRYMDNAPHDFILNHSENDLKPFLQFKHRTFNPTDALYFIAFFRWHYRQHQSLEEAFFPDAYNPSMETRLNHFFHHFFSLPDHPKRTYKHIPSPMRNSACKRMNMFLRWMIRKDDQGVDFGIWDSIDPSELICPCDLHVDRVARRLGLITRRQTDWKTALELTENLRLLDAHDPVKYDFALFGLGIEERYPML